VKEKQKLILVLSFYFLLSFLLFFNLLSDNGLWDYGDAFFSPTHKAFNNLFKYTFSTWYDREFLGIPNTSYLGPIKLFYNIFYMILFFFLDNPSVVQFFWYFLTFIISNVSMFILCKSITKNTEAAFFSSLIYSLSPWMVNRLASHLLLYQASAFLPLLYFFYYKFTNTLSFKYSIFFSLITVVIISSQHISYISFFIIFFYFLFVIFFEIRGMKEKRELIIYNIILIGITILVNLFYLLPLLFTGISRESSAISNLSTAIYYYGQNQGVLNSLRLLGFHDSFYDYSNILLVFSTFIVIVLCIFSFVQKRKDYRIKYFFGSILLFFLFTSSFTKLIPSNSIRILQKIPVLNVFFSWPDPNYSILGILFSAVILINIALTTIIENINCLKALKILIFIILIFVIISNGLPLIVKKDNRYKQFNYPSAYYALNEYFNSDYLNYRILTIPPMNSVKHIWAPYITLSSLDLLSQRHPLLGIRTLEATNENSYDYINKTIEFLEKGGNAINILSNAGVKFIVIFKDIEEFPPHLVRIKNSLKNYMEKIPLIDGLIMQVNNKYYKIYELDDNNFIPLIHASVRLYYHSGKTDLYSILDQKSTVVYVDPGKSEMDSTDMEFTEGLLKRSNEYKKPIIEYKKLRPWKYRVYAKNVNNNFLLVFNETYDEKWRLYLNKNIYPIQEKMETSGKPGILKHDRIFHIGIKTKTKLTLNKTRIFHYKERELENSLGQTFISKKMKNTIQNNNLSDGHFFETWGLNHVSNKYHWIANGYANSWWIDLDAIKCIGTYNCNTDVSYNIEMILEYYPQRFFYFGIIITGLSLFGFLVILSMVKK